MFKIIVVSLVLYVQYDLFQLTSMHRVMKKATSIFEKDNKQLSIQVTSEYISWL